MSSTRWGSSSRSCRARPIVDWDRRANSRVNPALRSIATSYNPGLSRLGTDRQDIRMGQSIVDYVVHPLRLHRIASRPRPLIGLPTKDRRGLRVSGAP